MSHASPLPLRRHRWSTPKREHWGWEQAWIIGAAVGDVANVLRLVLSDNGFLDVGTVPPGYTLADLVEGERRLREAAEKGRAPATREGAGRASEERHG